MRIPLQKRGDVFLAKCKLVGQRKMDILGIVDSGSSVTFVSTHACELAELKYKGSEKKFMCVHGKAHRQASVKRYRGVVTVGEVSGSGLVYELDVRPAVKGLRADAVLGRDVLRNFDVGLNWRAGTGFLEG